MVPEVFRQACMEEVPAVFELIMGRVRWMDEKGIRQWNVTNYADCYPLTYYEAARQRGDLFVMAAAGEIIACAVLKQEDDRWPQAMQAAEPAFYLHHFATRVGERGVGRVFLQRAEDYAVQQGKTRMRLDSADDNPVLTAYYTALGYVPVGTCVDGLYTGILREKVLTGAAAEAPLQPVEPHLACEQAIWAFREDYIAAGEGVETLGSLAQCESVREWLEKIAPFREEATTPPGRVPTRFYLYQREADGKIVGLVQIRQPLNEYYEKFAGHIGYTVCPSERRKGYASQLLQSALGLCHEMGVADVLVCCAPENEASRRTILRCGGVQQDTAVEPVRHVRIERYLI